MPMFNDEISDEPVFLLGIGRCGSTLLQRLLNTHSDFCIWGEHGGFLAPIANSFFILQSDRSLTTYAQLGSEKKYEDELAKLRDPAIWSAWTNPFDRTFLTIHFRNFIRNFFVAARGKSPMRWGFKEIRYGYNNRVAQMLKILFPRARFIIVTREPFANIKSMLLGFEYNNLSDATLPQLVLDVAQRWSNANTNFIEFCDTNPDISCLIRYEDILRDAAGETEKLSRFLSCENRFLPDKVLSITLDTTNKSSDSAQLVDDYFNQPHSALHEVISPTANRLGYVIDW